MAFIQKNLKFFKITDGLKVLLTFPQRLFTENDMSEEITEENTQTKRRRICNKTTGSPPERENGKNENNDENASTNHILENTTAYIKKFCSCLENNDDSQMLLENVDKLTSSHSNFSSNFSDHTDRSWPETLSQPGNNVVNSEDNNCVEYGNTLKYRSGIQQYSEVHIGITEILREFRQYYRKYGNIIGIAAILSGLRQ